MIDAANESLVASENNGTTMILISGERVEAVSKQENRTGNENAPLAAETAAGTATSDTARRSSLADSVPP